MQITIDRVALSLEINLYNATEAKYILGRGVNFHTSVCIEFSTLQSKFLVWKLNGSIITTYVFLKLKYKKVSYFSPVVWRVPLLTSDWRVVPPRAGRCWLLIIWMLLSKYGYEGRCSYCSVMIMVEILLEVKVILNIYFICIVESVILTCYHKIIH